MIIRQPEGNLLVCLLLFELQSQGAAHPIPACKERALTMLFLITAELITAINAKKQSGQRKSVLISFSMDLTLQWIKNIFIVIERLLLCGCKEAYNVWKEPQTCI